MQYDNRYLEKDISYYRLDRGEMLGFVPAGAKRILEVGCGNGAFALAVKKRQDCEYWGIEPYEDAAREAGKIVDRLIVGLLHADDLPDTYFDCIIFNDVLEHFTDPGEVLRLLRSKLSRNGYIVASIPNFVNYINLVNILTTEDFRYEDSGILDKTHYRFFTKKSIERLFREQGYEIKRLEGINRNIFSLKYKVLNFIFFNRLYNYRFLQFGVLAQLN